MITISLTVRKVWILLQNTEQGCFLQTTAGTTVYYYYSDTTPSNDIIGFVEDTASGPTRLNGGKIWVKSKDWSKVAYSPYNVDGETLFSVVGDLPTLDTDDKSSVVAAVNELHADLETKLDSDDVGDLSPQSIDFLSQYTQVLTS